MTMGELQRMGWDRRRPRGVCVGERMIRSLRRSTTVTVFGRSHPTSLHDSPDRCGGVTVDSDG